MFATNECIARSSFDTCDLVITKNRITIQQVVEVKTITAQSISSPSPTFIIHVTEKVAIVTFLEIAAARLGRCCTEYRKQTNSSQ